MSRPSLTRLSAALLLSALIPVVHAATPAKSAKAAKEPIPPAAQVEAHADALNMAQRIVQTKNNEGKTFAIIDKPHAAVSIYSAEGKLMGISPVLLGLSTGDDSVPGIGDRPMRLIKPEERTTPAGRFVSKAGRNTDKEDVVWVDYDAAVSMHRVRANVKSQRRLERLASPTTDDNRISYGCVNVPADFYDAMVKPNFSDQVGMIYVLPDKKSVAEVFDFMRSPSAAMSTPAGQAGGAQ